MKKGVMVVLALVMALTLVMGSVSTVSAANPNRTLEVTIYGVNPYFNRINYQFKWEGYNNAYGYSLIIHNDTTDNDIATLGQIFDQRMTFMTVGTSSNGANTTDDFTITLTLLKRNGSPIESTSATLNQ